MSTTFPAVPAILRKEAAFTTKARLAWLLVCMSGLALGIRTVRADELTPTISYRGDGKTVATFATTGTGTWTIPDHTGDLEILVVGGGGSGSYWGYSNAWPSPSWGSGGGGGGVYQSTAYTPSGGSVVITVGTGGAAGNTGSAGTDSEFDGLIAYGGSGSALGAGGAAGGNNQGGASHAGGTDSGGGGGAGQVGQNGWYGQAKGGDGVSCSITGSALYYGGGGSTFYNGAQGGQGGGGSTYDAYYLTPEVHGNPHGVDGRGGGGAGARNALSEVGSGGDGVVIVAYQGVAVTYTVTFDSNGGSAVASQVVSSGSTVPEPAPPPTKTGHTFVRWCADDLLTIPFVFSTPITADTTLYAEWVINTYMLTYGADTGGSILGTSPQTVEHGGSGTEVTAQADPGYRFVRWSDNSTSNPRTDTNVTASINVTAIFEVVPTDTIAPTSITTRGDGRTVATFTTGSGVWTIPDHIGDLEILVVGGGGSGSYWGYSNAWPSPSWGSGGGGGGVYQSATYTPSGGSVVITVGTGGAAGNTGSAGSNSEFDGLIAYGGSGSALGAGGAAGGNNQGGASHAGGTDSGGGGGAGQVGQNGWYTQAKGGDGVSCSITGSALYYGGGGSTFYNGAQGGQGGGGSTYDAYYLTPEVHGNPHGVDGRGGGGAGGRNALSEVGSGGDGVVIVAYLGTGGNYTTWAATNGIIGGADAVGPDGIKNLMLYALDLKLDGTNGSPGTVDGDRVLSFTKRTEAANNGDVSYVIEESDDLGQTDPWTEVTSYEANNGSVISYRLPSGKSSTFARLVVTQQ